MKINQNIKKIVTYTAIAIIFSLLIGNIIQNWEEIQKARVNFSITLFLILLISGCALHLLNTLSWHLMTKALRLQISFWENMRIWILPNISRYIPGVVWQYMGRVYMLGKFGVSKSQAAVVVALDALFTFSIGALVVMLAISFFSFPSTLGVEKVLILFIPIPFVVAFVFSNQKLISIMLQVLQKVTKKNYSTKAFKFSPVWLAVVSLVTFSQFLVAGGVLFMIAGSFHELPLYLLPVFAAVYAGSWILGYVSFFAPGGLGVQELSIAGLLSLFMPFPLASLAAILFRFAITLSELVVLSFVFALAKRTSKIN